MPTTDWNTRNDKGNKARNISGYKPWNCRNWQVHLMLYQPVRIVCLLWISGSMKLPKKYQQLWCKRRRSKPWFYDWYFCRQRKREGLWNSSADNSANRLYWAHEMIHHFTAQPCYTMPSPKRIRHLHNAKTPRLFRILENFPDFTVYLTSALNILINQKLGDS